MASSIVKGAADTNAPQVSSKLITTLKNAKNNVAPIVNKSLSNGVFMTVIATLVAVVIVLMLWASGTEYRPLYSKNANFDSSEVLRLLDEGKIQYELNADSGLILVPHDDVARTRMFLASKGLKEQLPSGFDALTENMAVGESQFMENARYKHALEGELARSVVTIDAISAARVHLAIPKESLFKRRDSNKPTASVVTNIINGMSLKPEQVDAIINIVSGAVIGMKPENVKVVDQYGRLLSSKINSGDIAFSTSKQSDFKQQIEDRLVEQASDMLMPVLGSSNFRVQIASDIDFSKTEETQETYENPVVRTESLLNDSQDGNAALGVPGSLSNSPPVTDGEETPTPESKNIRNETNRTYAVGGRVIKIQHQQGNLKKLFVSVVLNQNAQEQWGDETINTVQTMVSNAIGLQPERGDEISIAILPFIPASGLVTGELPWYQNPSYLAIARYTFITLITILLLAFVLRPMVNHLISSSKEGSHTDLVPAEKAGSDNESLSENSKLQRMVIDLPSPDSAIEEQIEHLRLIADADPERVSEILQTWMKGTE